MCHINETLLEIFHFKKLIWVVSVECRNSFNSFIYKNSVSIKSLPQKTYHITQKLLFDELESGNSS